MPDFTAEQEFDLQELARAIFKRGIDEIGMPFKLCIDDWIRLQAAAETWCSMHDRVMLSSPDVDRPNFIWAGVPVVCY